MINEHASRRAALRVGAVGILAGALSACATAPASGTSNIVTMTPAQVAAQGSAVLAAFSGAAKAYITDNPGGVAQADQDKIATAENAAQTALNSIVNADLSSVPGIALTVANTLAAVAMVIPGLPAAAVAGILAFQVLAAALEPLIGGQAGPLGAMAPMMAVRPGTTRVLLVSNH